MTSPEPAPKPFFVPGGSLPPDTPSYVVRPADRELLESTLAGQYCWVLTTRQMGKSSLMARTASRLRELGVRTATIDLSLKGKDKRAVGSDRWYYGIAHSVLRELQLEVDLGAWWQSRDRLPAVQRFAEFFEDVVLERVPGPVVVFFDEIDSTIGLEFADDFFVAIRSCHNARANDPKWERLTFVLLGAATPDELISDTTRTPFNVGRGIDLTDFTRDEAAHLAAGLPPADRDQVLDRILYWTDGHPFLTQLLCGKVSKADRDESPEADGEARVDEIVASALLSRQAVREESNLKFVAARLSRLGRDTRKVLQAYLRVHRGERVRDEPASLVHATLKLSGVVKRTPDAYLRVRNRVYEKVFSPRWVHEVMPSSKTRSLAATAVTFLVVALVTGGIAVWQNRQASATEYALRIEAANPEDALAALVEESPPIGTEAIRSAVQRRGRIEDVLDTAMALPETERGRAVARVIELAMRLLLDGPATYDNFSTAVWAADYVAATDPDTEVRQKARDQVSRLRRGLRDAVEERTGNRPVDDLNPRIPIQGGRFRMGTDDADVLAGGTPHWVTVQEFEIQEHEVTNEEYWQFDPDRMPEDPEEPERVRRLPIVSVTWYEAMAYAAWLGGSLPTEAQWEFAARGPGAEPRPYPWGDPPMDGEMCGVFTNCFPEEPAPVKSYPNGATPPPAVVYDLVGNVWEWSRDWLGRYPVGETDEPQIGPPTPEVPMRMVRGGSLGLSGSSFHAASRSRSQAPASDDGYLGFRVAFAAAGGRE